MTRTPRLTALAALAVSGAVLAQPAAAADCGVIVDAMPGSTAAAIAVADASSVVDFSKPSLIRRKKKPLLTHGRWCCSNSLVVVGIHGRADVEGRRRRAAATASGAAVRPDVVVARRWMVGSSLDRHRSRSAGSGVM